jgi:RNA polymerase sigma-70 factor (ECF subfamily)
MDNPADPTTDAASTAAELHAPVRRFLGRLVRDDALADDLASETMLVLLGRDAAGAPIANRLSFALGVAWRKSREARRARRVEELAEDRDVPADASAAARRATELRDWLEVAYARLTADDRALLALRFEEDLSYREIATTLGIGVPLVCWRLRRARLALQTELRRTGGGAGATLGAALLLLFAPSAAHARVPAACAGSGSASAAGTAATSKTATTAAAAFGGWILMAKTTAWLGATLALVFGGWRMVDGPNRAAPNASDAAGPAAAVAVVQEPTLAGGAAAQVASSPFEDARARSTAISGRAVDGRGLPVANASVRAIASGATIGPFGPTATTDAEGRFQATLPSADGASFFDLKGAHPDLPEAWCVGIAAGATDVVVRFRRGVRLHGAVRSPNGEPLAGVRATLRYGARPSAVPRERRLDTTLVATTDDAGAYAFPAAPDLDRISFAVEFEKTGRIPATRSSAEAFEDFGEDGKPAYRLDVVLPPGTPVEGRVLDAADGTPIADADVSLGVDTTGRVPRPQRPSRPPSVRAVTDAAGRFRVDGVDPSIASEGDVGLRVSTDEHGTFLGRAPLETSEKGVRTLVLRLPRGADVRGRVVDGDGRPIAGARVDLAWVSPRSGVDERATTITERDGAYRLNGCSAPPGATVRIALARAVPTGATTKSTGEVGVVVASSRATFAPDLVVRSTSLARILFRVVDGAGAPVAGAEVDYGTPGRMEALSRGLGTAGASAIADAAGRVAVYDRLGGSPPVLFRIRAPGFAPQTTLPLAFAAPEAAQEIRIELLPARRIGGRVTHADGAPAAHCVVRAEAQRHPAAADSRAEGRPLPQGPRIVDTVETDETGAFTLRDVEAGPVVVRAVDRGVRYATTAEMLGLAGVEPPADAATSQLVGDADDLLLVLPVPSGRGSVTATVRRADGKPAERAKGYLLRKGKRIAFGKAEADSADVSWRGVAAGPYELRLESADGPPTIHAVEILAGRRTKIAVVHGPMSRGAGRIVAANGGAPPAGTVVVVTSADGETSFSRPTDADGNFPLDGAGAGAGAWSATALSRAGLSGNEAWFGIASFEFPASGPPTEPLTVRLRNTETAKVRFVGASRPGSARFRAEARDAEGRLIAVVQPPRVHVDGPRDLVHLCFLPRGVVAWKLYRDGALVAERTTPFAGETELVVAVD